jgi:hypothetical protein
VKGDSILNDPGYTAAALLLVAFDGFFRAHRHERWPASKDPGWTRALGEDFEVDVPDTLQQERTVTVTCLACGDQDEQDFPLDLLERCEGDMRKQPN